MLPDPGSIPRVPPPQQVTSLLSPAGIRDWGVNPRDGVADAVPSSDVHPPRFFHPPPRTMSGARLSREAARPLPASMPWNQWGTRALDRSGP